MIIRVVRNNTSTFSTRSRPAADAWRPKPVTMNFEERVFPPHKIAAIVAALADNGVSAAEALDGTGIRDHQLAETLISYRQMHTVCHNALRLSPDPALALAAGRKMNVTAFGMYGYALLSSPNHVAAIDFAVKYQDMMGPPATICFRREGDLAVYTHEPILEADPAQPLYRFVLEFQFASQMTIMKDLYDKSFRFAELRAAYAAPAHVQAYAALFECPVYFDQAVNEVDFDARRIEQPMSYANPITHSMAMHACDLSLREVSRAGSVTAQVYRELLARAGHFPDIEGIAAGLSMNSRTLRRKLDAEQTSYREIVAEVRMQLAIEYLRKTRMTNEEIAARLGYSDASNFRHAFKRWTSRHPSDYRGR